VHAVTTGCFEAYHLQRLVYGGEPGAGSGMYRPKPEAQVAHRPEAAAGRRAPSKSRVTACPRFASSWSLLTGHR